MNKMLTNCVTFLIDPFGYEKEPHLFILSGGKAQPLSVETLSEIDGYIVTHDFWMLVDYFRNKSVKLPQNIVDVTFVAKLLIGRPKRELSGSKPWEIWQLLEDDFDNKEDLIRLRDYFFLKNL